MGEIVRSSNRLKAPAVFRYWGRVLAIAYSQSGIGTWAGLGISLSISIALAYIGAIVSRQPPKEASKMIQYIIEVFAGIMLLAIVSGLIKTPPRLDAELAERLRLAEDEAFWRQQKYRLSVLENIKTAYLIEKSNGTPQDLADQARTVISGPPFDFIEMKLKGLGETWDFEEVRRIEREGKATEPDDVG